MTVRKAIALAKQEMGLSVKLVKSARLPNDVLVVEHVTESGPLPGMEKQLRTWRVDVFVGDSRSSGMVIKNDWFMPDNQ